MYLHLGQDVVVRQREIVGVFDMEYTTISRYTRGYLRDAEKEGRVVYASMELPKSFVVCSQSRRRGKARPDTVYISQIAPATLKKRSRLMDSIANIKGGADDAE